MNNDNPKLLTVRSTQSVAKFIEMHPQPVANIWLRNGIFVLATLGLSAAIYLGILLLQFLIPRTPFGH